MDCEYRSSFQLKISTRTLWVSSVAEVILLTIGISEDIVTKEVHTNNRCSPSGTQFNLVEDQIPRLERVNARNPTKIADGEHEPKPVSGDIHLGEDSRLSGSELITRVN